VVWEKLLGYEPASRLLVKDTGDPALVHIRIVVEDEEQDKGAILWAMRKTFENGHSLPPDLGLAVCALLEAKNPAHKPPTPDAQKLQSLNSAERYAELLGAIRVRRIMEGHPRFAEQADIDLCKHPGAGMTVGTTTFKKFREAHRLATLCGEVREINRMLADGIITIEGDYQKWVKALKKCKFLPETQTCRDRLEWMFKKNS
jgi:hypothetical protein